MFSTASIALLLLVCIGLALRNRRLAGELFDARWALSRALEKELKTRPPKVHVHVVRPESSKREPGCRCHWEVGDSPCPVHGENEEAPVRGGDAA